MLCAIRYFESELRVIPQSLSIGFTSRPLVQTSTADR